MLKNKDKNTFDKAEALLLQQYEITSPILDETLGLINSRDVDFSDIFFQYTRSESWSLDEGIVKSGSFSIDQGFGIRAVSGDKTAFSFSDSISKQSLFEAARTTRSISNHSSYNNKGIKTSKFKNNGNLYEGYNSLYSNIDPVLSLLIPTLALYLIYQLPHKSCIDRL